MATPAELAAGMERELWDFVRVLKHLRNNLEARSEDSNFIGDDGGYTFTLRASYKMLEQLSNSYIDEIQGAWKGLRGWADEYAGIPDTAFNAKIPEAPVARLRRVMATNNVLTRTQYESGFTNQNYKPNGSFAEKFYGIMDRFAEMCILFGGRCQWYVDEWAIQGTGDRAVEARTIMLELVGASAFGRNLVADEAIKVKNAQGSTIRDQRMRREYVAFFNVTGGLYLLNGGARPAGGPLPDEVDPDIRTVSTFPALANDPA